jgi:voltage-gated cation channel
MYNGIDIREVDEQPKKNAAPAMSLYFISFILIGNLFILNLFVGIVIDKFNRLKDRMCGYSLMTSHQREWIETESATARLNLLKLEEPPESTIRLICWKIAVSQYFEAFIVICIIGSTVEMSLMYY